MASGSLAAPEGWVAWEAKDFREALAAEEWEWDSQEGSAADLAGVGCLAAG